MLERVAKLKGETASGPIAQQDGIAALRRTAAKWSSLALLAVAPCVAVTAILTSNPWPMPTLAAFVVAFCALGFWRFAGGDAALTRYVIAVATVVQVSLLVLAAGRSMANRFPYDLLRGIGDAGRFLRLAHNFGGSGSDRRSPSRPQLSHALGRLSRRCQLRPRRVSRRHRGIGGRGPDSAEPQASQPIRQLCIGRRKGRGGSG